MTLKLLSFCITVFNSRIIYNPILIVIIIDNKLRACIVRALAFIYFIFYIVHICSLTYDKNWIYVNALSISCLIYYISYQLLQSSIWPQKKKILICNKKNYRNGRFRVLIFCRMYRFTWFALTQHVPPNNILGFLYINRLKANVYITLHLVGEM